jgi:NAD(P)-dependent dehydrogenase (short-subunit alcohol dehydrogenase family)
MKIIIVGASGTIGKHVVKALEANNEIVKVGSKSGDFQIDMANLSSIESLFEQVGAFDALVSVAGDAHFGPLPQMVDSDFRKGVDSKLMGQINLVLVGQRYINPKGSFTLTSGTLAEDPIVYGAAVSAINGALNGFVRAAYMELENGVRINAVAPGVVAESPGFFSFFPGDIPVEMHRVAQAYVKSVLGGQSGQVYKVV